MADGQAASSSVRAVRLIAGCAAIAVFGMAFGEFVLRSRLPAEADEPISEAWARSVAALGIRPVYPATEDLHVGDIWVYVRPPRDRPDAVEVPPPLLARGVRLGHVDLRAQIIASDRRRPVFPSHQAGEAAIPAGALLEEGGLPPEQRIRLVEVSFPSLTRRRSFDASAGGSVLLATLRGTQRQSIVEEFSIPRAFGYGMEADAAVEALAGWCASDRARCNASYLTSLLRFVHGAESAPEGTSVGLLLVSYVFVTRAVVFKRQREDASGLALAPQQDANSSAGTLRPEASANAASNNAVSVTTQFQRPVVIGFRAVAIAPPVRAAGAGSR